MRTTITGAPKDTFRFPRPAAWAAALVLAGCLLGAGAALAQQAGGQEKITLNLKDADITALISTVAEVTGRNFIIDPRVKAKVTVISKEAMAPEELYRVFQSVLQVHGFAAVESGPIIKIVPDINAKQIGIRTVGRGSESDEDEMVTRVIVVQNIPVAQLVPILRPLVPQQGHLAAYPPTNVLIISDRASNIERMADLIRRIDLASDEEIEIVRLEHAGAAEMVRLVNSLVQQPNDPNQPPSGQVKIAADERTNSVLLSGDRSQRLRVRALIAHLDTPLESGGDTKVIYLRYAKAADVVQVLTGVSENLQKAEQPGGGGGQPAQGGQRRVDVNIEAHEATNALVITAPPKLQRSLEMVIRQLDIRRAQVLVEAAVAELTDTRGRSVGVELIGRDQDGEGPFVGSIFRDLGGLFTSAATGGTSAIAAGLLNTGLNVAVGDLDSRFQFGVLLQALATNGNTNILSTPSLVTMDNQEAEIRVAENVPFVTGSYTSSSGNVSNPFTTVEREDVGIILKIKPQINEGNSVLLDIEQEVSSVLSTDPVLGPSTSKRSIKTSVMVEDGQMLALGGLIQDDVSETESKIPLLGDIPLLGHLFKSRGASVGKRNLMLFLQPTIVRDETSANAFTSRKYNYMRAEQLRKREQGGGLLGNELKPVLPKLERTALPPPFEPVARN